MTNYCLVTLECKEVLCGGCPIRDNCMACNDNDYVVLKTCLEHYMRYREKGKNRTTRKEKEERQRFRSFRRE